MPEATFNNHRNATRTQRPPCVLMPLAPYVATFPLLRRFFPFPPPLRRFVASPFPPSLYPFPSSRSLSRRNRDRFVLPVRSPSVPLLPFPFVAPSLRRFVAFPSSLLPN